MNSKITALLLGIVTLVAIAAVVAVGMGSATGAPGLFAKVHGWIAVRGVKGIVAFDPDHPKQRVLLAPRFGDPLAWSRDGSKLLAVAGDEGLYVLHGDGRWVRVAPDGSTGGSFTPDGSHVVYEHNHTIYKVSSGGGRAEVIVKRPAGSGFGFPDFTGGQLSPDGTAIVYGGLSLMRSDGTHRRALATPRAIAALTGHPDANQIAALGWFPGSKRILFIALNQSTTHCALLTVNTDGTHLRHWGPARFCPDSRLILTRSSPGRIHELAVAPDRGDHANRRQPSPDAQEPRRRQLRALTRLERCGLMLSANRSEQPLHHANQTVK